MEDDRDTEKLREHIREGLGTRPVDRRRAGPFGQFFAWICIATPFVAYAVIVYRMHGFHDMSEFWRWFQACLKTKCPD